MNADDLKRMAEAVSPAGDNLARAAYLAYQASHAIAGEGWRALYTAHWASAHPCPDPIEAGVLQAGDRVRVTGDDGARQGPATVVRITGRDLGFGRRTLQVEYALDMPYTYPDGSQKLGGSISPGGIVHLRDWPMTYLADGKDPRYEVREGEGPLPEGWPAA